jgi:HEPN domain-containing protein
MPDRTALAEEWFERGSSDLRAARRSFDAADYTTTLAVLIHQAVEKYLKGFLIVHGWKLKKTHNLVELDRVPLSTRVGRWKKRWATPRT